MSIVQANGTTLHYERRGRGPVLLLIAGAGGDGAMWTSVGDRLAPSYTVVTYDRRVNSRSGPSSIVGAAGIDGQADDAAALLRALDLAPAFVYGSSLGAAILASLALRHREVLRAAVFHEPPFAGVTSAPGRVAEQLNSVIANGMVEGGPARAMERFLEWIDGEAAGLLLRGATRKRILGNGEVFIGSELKAMHAFLPRWESLADIALPCTVVAAADHRDPNHPRHWLYEATQWLGRGLRAPFVEAPGGHLPQLTHPEAFAGLLAPLFLTGAAADSGRTV